MIPPSASPKAMMITLRINTGCRRTEGVEKKKSMTAIGMSVAEQAVPMSRNLIDSASAAMFDPRGGDMNTAEGAEAEDMARRQGLMLQRRHELVHTIYV